MLTKITNNNIYINNIADLFIHSFVHAGTPASIEHESLNNNRNHFKDEAEVSLILYRDKHAGVAGDKM